MANQSYTTGGEFRIYKTGEEYVGFYFEKNGEFYGGIEAVGENYIYLVDYSIGKEAAEFRNLKSKWRKKLKPPGYFKPRPTEEDYEKMVITRYFIKNNHNKDVFEVDKKSYKYYNKKDNPIKNIYSTIELQWKIAGPEFDVVGSDDTILSTGVFNTNKRTLERYSDTFPELLIILNLTDLAKITS